MKETGEAGNLLQPLRGEESRDVDNSEDSAESSADVNAQAVAHNLILHANRSSHKGEGLLVRSLAPTSTRMLVSHAPAMCEEVKELLEAHPHVSMHVQFLNMLCKDEYECDEVFPDVHRGCLYVSTDTHVQGALRSVGRPHPCKFAQMMINSYFTGEGCPTEQPSDSVRSLGGVAYATCEGGFRTKNGTCIEARLVGVTANSSVRVFALEGHIGMPPTWHKQIESGHGHGAHMTARMMGRAGAVPTHTELAINITVCEPWAEAINASDEQLEAQVAKLREGYSGNSECLQPTAYFYEPVDMNLSFRLLKPVNRIVDERCGVCDWYYKTLWAEKTPQVPGQIQVLFCKSDGIVGYSAFPEAEPRGIMIDYRTLPGGKYRNYNYGNTLIHEMGHYLGLLHTFQEGCNGNGDMISDTSPEAYPFFGCPKAEAPRRSCAIDVDPFHNFMDYTDDRCMCGFTRMQKERVWDHLAESMSDLIPEALLIAGATREGAEYPQ